MLVLIKVGNFLTYRYAGNIDSLKKEFSEYTPDFEIITTREDDSLYYFEAIPKLIPEEYLYKKGWYHDHLAVRDIFEHYKRQEGEYTKIEFEIEVKNFLRRKINELLVGNTWGIDRMKDLLEQDIRTMTFKINSDIVNVNKEHNIQVQCRIFPKGGAFEVAPGCNIAFSGNESKDCDPLLRDAKKYMMLQAAHINSGLKEKLQNDFNSLVLDKKNPYIIKHEDILAIDVEKAKSFGEAQRIIHRFFGVGK